MSIEIIPAILEKKFSAVKQKIKKIEPYVKWAQLDIMDGKFVANITWNNPADLKKLKTNLNLAAHLMIRQPHFYLAAWLNQKNVKRIIIHREAAEHLTAIIMQVKNQNKEIGVALNPETPLETIKNDLVVLDEILIMSVAPGFSGQTFDSTLLTKIKHLRALDPNINIAVDGGVNENNAKDIISAGANRLISASYLWQQKNIKQAIEQLKKV